MPNYALEPRASAGSQLLWVPRVLLWPLYALTEYGVRRPARGLVQYAQEHYWFEHIDEWLTFGPNDEFRLTPEFVLDLGFRPRGGATITWSGALVERNRMSLSVDAGRGGWTTTFRDRWSPADDQKLEVSVLHSQRQDLTYWGLGPDADELRERYGLTTTQLRVAYATAAWRSSHWGYEVAAARRDLRADGEAFSPDYQLGRMGVEAVLDTRLPRHAPSDAPKVIDWVSPAGTGLRVAARAALVGIIDSVSSRPSFETASSWLDYGGSLAGYWDVTGAQRSIGLWLGAQFVEPVMSEGQIPFLEGVTLGGEYPMAGLRRQRLVGESSVAARLDYRWPIWVSYDAVMGVAVGNVFGQQLRGFAFERLRANFDWGIRTTGFRDQSFAFLVGVGTSSFESGAELQEIRFVTGSSSRF